VAAPTRLRRWRVANRLTLREVADLTGLSVAMLSRTERRQRQLAPMTKVEVARRLGTRVAELFDVESGSEEMPDDTGVGVMP
jgi:transcriptional regulator with XRE-family HTH domain